MSIYDETRKECAKLLNIENILKKLFYFEKSLSLLFSHHQLIGLHLQQKISFK